MRKIKSKDNLLKKLKIKSLGQLNDPNIQQKFIPIASTLSPELAKEVIAAVPELAKVLTEVIKSMKDIGVSLQAKKRMRWEALKSASDSGTLTGEQFLEAMKIIQVIEIKEHIDWDRLLQKIVNIAGVLVCVIASVIFLGMRGEGDSEAN